MKVMILLEHIRENYITKDNQVNFMATGMGAKLRKYLNEVGIPKDSYIIDYAYDRVPDAQKVDKKTGRILKYNTPTLAMRKEPEDRLMERILAYQPDIIIPMGNMGCKFLLKEQAITKLRGRPSEVEIKRSFAQGEVSYTTWVLPIFSMEYILAKPNAERFVQSDMTVLAKFMADGSEAYEAKQVNYEFVTDISRVKEIFNQFKTPPKQIPEQQWVVAWDLETNTLKPERLGAKPLVMSMSWDFAQGVTIPLEHKDFSWDPEDLKTIYNLIRDFQEDSNIIKVGHNIQYDIRFLMSTKGLKTFMQNRDTKIAYYLSVSQEADASLRLSDLAFEMTDMGGYDNDLEQYKKDYIKNYNLQEKERVVREHTQDLTEWELECNSIVELDRVKRDQYKEEGKKLSLLPKPVLPPKPKKPSIVPLTNEIDGGDFNYEWIPLEVMHPYASGDTDCCLRIYRMLEAQLKANPKMWKLYTEFYPRLSKTLARVESNGIATELDYMKDIDREYTKEAERLTEELRNHPAIKEFEQYQQDLYTLAMEHFSSTPPKERNPELVKLRTNLKKNGTKFRPSSATDKKKVLFDILDIKPPYDKESIVDKAWDAGTPEANLTWKDYKSNKHNLEYIETHYPEHKELAQLFLAFSKVITLRNNFTKKLIDHVSNKDGKVHGSFNPTGTATGRLSSSNPNQQQVPSKVEDPNRFDYHYPIKRMFKTEFENGTLVQLDYQALEMRVVALRAKDKTMTQAFLDDKDLHTNTASLAFRVPEEEVSKDLRKKAKGVAFGIVYGESPSSFAPKYDMTVNEAQGIFDAFLASKPAIKDFVDWSHAFVTKYGYVETMQGFRRNLKGALSKDKKLVNDALRQSVNTIIQGTGAYLTNLALVYIDEWLIQSEKRSKVVLTVHDSIVLDCPPEELEEVVRIARAIMENLPEEFLMVDWITNGTSMRYPIKADVEIGSNYNDMVDYGDDFKEFSSTEGYVKYYKSIGMLDDYKKADIIPSDKAEAEIANIEANKGAYKLI